MIAVEGRNGGVERGVLDAAPPIRAVPSEQDTGPKPGATGPTPAATPGATDPDSPINLAAAMDLRIQRRVEIAEVLLERAAELPQEDRLLLEAIFQHGSAATHVAKLLGVAARKVRRRVRRLAVRIGSPEFQFVRRNLDRLRGIRRKVAITCIIHGRSMRHAATSLGVKFHTVRRHMDAIVTLYESACTPARWKLAFAGGDKAEDELTAVMRSKCETLDLARELQVLRTLVAPDGQQRARVAS